jgi:hypothetical protein
MGKSLFIERTDIVATATRGLIEPFVGIRENDCHLKVKVLALYVFCRTGSVSVRELGNELCHLCD